MPAPIAKGLIIAASVLVAAGIAAYNENPEFREWLERSRRKIAVAFESFGHDGKSQRPRPTDRSMSEDQDEDAEERRRQARQEILEKGRLLQERSMKRASPSGSVILDEKKSSSFDTLVDENGSLRPQTDTTQGISTAVEAQDVDGEMRSRHQEHEQTNSLHQSVDAPMLLRQMSGPVVPAVDSWESRYEEEMRNTWNITLPERTAFAASSHQSESLIDLTPTTEDFPDPDVSIPSLLDLDHPSERAEYFSMPPSQRSSTPSTTGTESDYHYARHSPPMQTLEPRPLPDGLRTVPISSGASVAESHDQDRTMEFESEDDLSEFGDGVRTPASVWTEVGSTVSGDA